MKIAASLCLSLALFSPVFALRGTRKDPKKQRDRRAQDSTSTLINREGFYDETVPLSDEAMAEDTEGSAQMFDGPPQLNTGPELLEMPPGDVNLEDPEWQDYLNQEPWVMDNYGLYEDEARHKKSSSSKSDGKGGKGSGSSDGDDADGLCQEFCADYIATCEGANTYFNPDEPRGDGFPRITDAPARRRLIEGEALEIDRLDGTTVFESLPDCLEQCMEWPRPTNPDMYLNSVEIGVNSIGDTFWCRRTHLNLAMRDVTHFGAQAHCPFARPDGGGLCINCPIESLQTDFNGTAFDFIRAGAETSRHLGYCQMSFNDLVADCTAAGIDDRTLPLALAMIPIETEIIILNNNVGKADPVTGNVIGHGITEIRSQLFRGLICPECILGLYIDDGNVATLFDDSFTALREIQALSLNMQLIGELPPGLLANARKLREFSIYNSKNKPGMLQSIPSNLFSQSATMIRRVVISGHRSLTGLPAALFNNLDNAIVVLIMSNNGFTNNNINTQMFQNLISLQILDLSNNQFTTAEKGWFNGGWGRSLRNIYLQSNPITIMEDDIFDYEDCVLENVLMHDTDMISVPVGLFDFCQDTLISYTVSPRV